MSALNGQRLAKLTVETLEGMRTNESFDLFFESVKKKATKFDVEEPTLPRKRHRPKYSILQYVQGHEETARNTKAFHPQSAAYHFRIIFFDALDNVVMAIQDRFQQPSYQFFSNIEQFLLKSINSDPYQTEMDAFKNYTDDLDISALPAEIHVLRSIFKNEKVASFDEITEKIIKLSATERTLFGDVIKLMKLFLVAAATSATPERSFSLARRLKAWLRTTMTQKRFNSLAVLSFHKELTDKISLINVASEFVASKPLRKKLLVHLLSPICEQSYFLVFHWLLNIITLYVFRTSW